MISQDRQLIKQPTPSKDPKEEFFLGFIEYALRHGGVSFATSWMDNEGAMRNDKWRKRHQACPDICLYLYVSENTCRSEIIFYNKSREENFTTYMQKLYKEIDSNIEKYSCYFDDVTMMGMEQLKNASKEKYLILDNTLKYTCRIAFYNRNGFKRGNREEAYKYLLDTYKILDGLFFTAPCR